MMPMAHAAKSQKQLTAPPKHSAQKKKNVAPAPEPAPEQGVEVLGLRASPALRAHQVSDDQKPAYMIADHIEGDPDDKMVLTGNAEVRRIDGVIKGNEITYDRVNGEVTSVDNARLMREGSLAIAPKMTYSMDTGMGQLEDPNFWVGATGAHAIAQQATIFSRSTMRLTNATYTGCGCSNPSWYIKGDSFDLDFDENEGVAKNGVLYFKDVPILASPYLSFPVKRERKSGFLLPTYGGSSRGGLQFSVPYYFNLAPNYDATVTPRYLSKHGMQLGGEFRYLGPTYLGQTAGTYLNNDAQTGNDRWLFMSQHSQSFGNGFYASWNYWKVSDNDYFRDFSQLAINQASTTYLPQQGVFGWNGQYWNANLQVLKYQTLQDPDAPITPPYDKTPELTVNGQRYDWHGFDLEMNATATHFVFPDQNLPPGVVRPGPNGDRLLAYPSIAYPIVRAGWYITPKIGVNLAQYQNTNWFNGNTSFAGSANFPTSQFRSVPIMSIDSGMTFERDSTLFGKAVTQTLEPRLYYLRVPYRDQSTFPVYDTALADFSFTQAFQENIYSGWDRISNANQVTAALSTRYLDPQTGFERANLALGQQIYFQDQEVTLPNETPRTNVRSNFLMGAGAALTDSLRTDVAAQYDPYNNRWSRSTISARWSPQRLTTIALAYRYQRDPPPGQTLYQPLGQNQVSLAVQWPFTKRWYGVGRVDYSLRDNANTITDPNQFSKPTVTQAIAGLEYKGDCCWTGRVVFQRYMVSSNEADTRILFQLELTGLGSLGQDVISVLNRNIPGYQPVNPSQQPGTTYERYE
jgi:LPS-assembly protein